MNDPNEKVTQALIKAFDKHEDLASLERQLAVLKMEARDARNNLQGELVAALAAGSDLFHPGDDGKKIMISVDSRTVQLYVDYGDDDPIQVVDFFHLRVMWRS